MQMAVSAFVAFWKNGGGLRQTNQEDWHPTKAST
jgi:hypothetical protein